MDLGLQKIAFQINSLQEVSLHILQLPKCKIPFFDCYTLGTDHTKREFAMGMF